MLTLTEAESRVLTEVEKLVGRECCIVRDATIEKPYGWVIFYNSRRFIEGGESKYRLLGNGPVIVNKFDESMQFHGANRSIEQVIAEYEEVRKVR